MKFSLTIIVVFAFSWLSCQKPANVNAIEKPIALPGMKVDPGNPPPFPEKIPIKYLLGQFDPSEDTLFTIVENQYTDRPELFMHEDAYTAFKRMHFAASRDGISLRVLSATRNFDYQKQIWEEKWNGRTLVGGKNLSTTIKDPTERALQILTYSSMPGTSRHHWGSDIDLNNLDPGYFESSAGQKIYEWLSKHAGEYGYAQPYTKKDSLRPDGYKEEKWHWSYLPISKLCLASYNEMVTYGMITGFAGSETAEKIEVIKKYVMGIAKDCM